MTVTDTKYVELSASGAGPGLVLGGAHSLGGGHRPNIFYTFSEKPYEIKEMLVRRGAGRALPP